MAVEQRSRIIQDWPEEAQEAAQLVIDARGEPDEVTPTQLTWLGKRAAPWKRIVATRAFFKHEFPAPHNDSVESFVDYRVPVEHFTPLADRCVAGEVAISIDRTFLLTDVAQALARVGEGRALGKIVVTPA